jgi:hypothetical protein
LGSPDHNGNDGHFLAHVHRLVAVGGGIDGETFTLQSGRQGLSQRGLVFDQQHTHGFAP